jgi:N-acetylmuramoyl-L-alanine amidase
MAFTYRKALMPKDYRNRPGYTIREAGKAKSITVHNTGNPNATAANHAAFLSSAPRTASWHITVDDKEAVMHIPLNEQAWHSGTTAGNTSSIGIEVCEFSDPARARAAENNAELLIAEMLTGKAPAGWDLNWRGLANVVTHKYWSGKICPRVILPHWDAFKADIKKQMDAIMAPPPVVTPPAEVAYYEVRIHTSGPELPVYKSVAAAQQDFYKIIPSVKDAWKNW